MRSGLLLVLAVGVAAGLGLAGQSRAAAGKVTLKWPGGVVTGGEMQMSARAGKTHLTVTKDVQATARDFELLHADKATADSPAGTQIKVIKATGAVRFNARRAGKGDATALAGACSEATLYNPGDKRPKGDEKILVAELVGNVSVTMTQTPAAKKPGAKADAKADAPQTMTVEGPRAWVWLTEEDGLEVKVGEAE